MNMDEYCPIAGYEDLYGISKTSEVISFKTKNNLCPSIINGYKELSLWKNSKPKHFYVHTLMAITYLEKTSAKRKEVDHVDGNKLNNCITNLRFVTRSENMKNACRNNKNMFNTNKKSVNKLDCDGNVLEKYDSIASAAADTGLRAGSISLCCHGKSEKYAGYRWIFQEKEKKEINLEVDEIFVKINEINGLFFDMYEVSNFGKVRNTVTNKFMVPTCAEYNRLILWTRDKKYKIYSVHRLVAYFFIEKIYDPKFVVNHIDENKKNNYFKNLQWCTHSENKVHSTGKKVCKIDIKTNKILYVYSSINGALKELGNKKGGNISKCCANKVRSAYGFKWKYLEAVVDELVDNKYIEVTIEELEEYDNGILISYIANNQIRRDRHLISVTNDSLVYQINEQEYYLQFSDIEKIWIKKS